MSSIEDHKEQMIDTLVAIRGYVGKLAGGCSAISESFQNDETEQGQLMLADFLEGIGWVSEAVAVSGPVQEDYGVEVDLGELSQALLPAVEALQNEDYGLISDVLLFEVQPVLETWTQELSKIQRQP